MPALTVSNLKHFVEDSLNKTLAQEWVELKAIAQVTRKDVDSIYKPIFEKYTFIDHEGNKLTYEDNALFACDDDELVSKYFQESNDAVRQKYDIEPGYCPALVAEHNFIKHENKILEKMCPLLGVEHIYNMEDRRKAIDLFLQMVLNPPKK